MKIKVSSNKSFSLVFFVVFLLIALWPLSNNSEIRIWSFLLSIIFLILGLLNSKILSPMNKMWFKFGLFLGKFVSPLVMGIIFFLVVTPTGLIMKILKKDLLSLKYNKNSTYWIEKNGPKSKMRNQF